jgi:hypothetical protein
MNVRVVTVKMRRPEGTTSQPNVTLPKVYARPIQGESKPKVITTGGLKTSFGTSSQQAVRAELEKVRKVWLSSGRGPKDIYKYLQAVFDLEQRWEEQNTRDRNSEWILNSYKALNPPSEEEPFGAIIYATALFPSKEKGKQRNKWSHLLHHIRKAKETSVAEYIEWNGGTINKCLAERKDKRDYFPTDKRRRSSRR